MTNHHKQWVERIFDCVASQYEKLHMVIKQEFA